ncbi:flagellar hook-associated protein FlgK [Roseomonas sp. WA12]
MSLDLALSIARSGLSHVNRQLAQSASNIANAATPGYTRKEVQGSSSIAGSLASGVRTEEATRAVDTALTNQLNAARAATAAATARAHVLEGVEVAHGSTGESIGDLTSALGDAFVALRGDPSDTLVQSRVTTAAQGLTERYHVVSAAILDARQGAQDNMVQEVERLNGALRQVSQLTEKILPLRAQGISTAELEDKRDLAIASISSIMQVRSVEQENGGVLLITSGGLNLPLYADKGPFSIQPMTVGAQSFHGSGGTLPGVMLGGTDVTNRLGEGTLAAHAALRDEELPLAQAELDISAASLTARFDAQGLRLFTGDAGSVPDPAAAYSSGGWIGFAGAVRVNTAVLSDPAVARNGTHTVVGSMTGATAFTPNSPTGPADFTTLIDRVLNRSFGTEVSAGNPHPPFATTGLGPNGTLQSSLRSARSIDDYATQLVATQSAARAMAEEGGRASGDLLASLESRFSERAGVDIDKELSAMVTLQTAYAANARLVSVVQGMYDTLFQAVR